MDRYDNILRTTPSQKIEIYYRYTIGSQKIVSFEIKKAVNESRGLAKGCKIAVHESVSGSYLSRRGNYYLHVSHALSTHH